MSHAGGRQENENGRVGVIFEARHDTWIVVLRIQNDEEKSIGKPGGRKEIKGLQGVFSHFLFGTLPPP